MKNKIAPFVILFLLIGVFLAMGVAAGDYDDPGDDWGSSTAGSSEDSEPEDWSSAESAEEEDDESYDEDFDPGYMLDLEMRIYCHQGDRDGEAYKFLTRGTFESDGHIFYTADDYYNSKRSLLPFEKDFSENGGYSRLFTLETDFYSWITTPDVSITTESEDPYEDAKASSPRRNFESRF